MSHDWCMECGHREDIHGPNWCGVLDPNDPLCYLRCDCPEFIGTSDEDDAWWDEDEELTS